jgi:hypothetical protein
VIFVFRASGNCIPEGQESTIPVAVARQQRRSEEMPAVTSTVGTFETAATRWLDLAAYPRRSGMGRQSDLLDAVSVVSHMCFDEMSDAKS